jgi:hypothetical protein
LSLDVMARLREAKEKASLFERTHQQLFEANGVKLFSERGQLP